MVAELVVRPVGWCYQCGCLHEGTPPYCWGDVEPPTAAAFAHHACWQVLDLLVGDLPTPEASPEVLDVLARQLADLAERNRRRAR